MSAPIRIRLSRAKGWRMPPNTVKVDRTSRWGNPYRVTPNRTAADCVALYRDYVAKIMTQWPSPDRLAPLRGKNLACWCPLDQPCHADVLLELANREPERAS